MTQGARRADVPPPESGTQHKVDNSMDDWSVVPMSDPHSTLDSWEIDAEPRRETGIAILGAVLLAISAAWTFGIAWLGWQDGAANGLRGVASWIALACPPLILLGLVWLMWGRSSRREAQRFARSVAALRTESASLESLLALVATRLEENHARLTNEAAKLMSLGDEAADRLGRVAYYLSKEGANLDKRAGALETAANAARVDIGVLLHDLPRAEEQARAVAQAMREAGVGAHEQAGALEGQLAALVARGREVDDVVGSTAQKLAAHLARIESGSASAARLMDDAATSMNATVDSSMSRAAEAIEVARAGLEEQGRTTLAMIDQGRAALHDVGDEAARNLAAKLEMVESKIALVAQHLAAQDAASQALVSGLSKDLAGLNERFIQLAEAGLSGTERLETSMNQVRQRIGELSSDLGQGSDHAVHLIQRAQELGGALSAITRELEQTIPSGLNAVQAQAAQTQAATSAALPDLEAMQRAAQATSTIIAETGANISRQQETLEALVTSVGATVESVEQQLHSLCVAAEEADGHARRLTGESAPQLVDSLLRVRETAQQAAERAREALSAVIPQSAESLAEASRKALLDSVSGTVGEQLQMLNDLGERAVEAARLASERLTRQLLTIGKTTAAVEARIEETERAREDADSQALTRRVALLMESLNSTAIDVTKILSNEVTDTAWSAYLRGDRGVFTRRAVRLLSSGEARQIAQQYESDTEFRDQVNRYIHDFEAMLRRILAERDGNVLGVTLLSSDMGKLYVALAQAIERLR